MKPVVRSEVLGLGDYEQIRPQFRARIIEEKKRRRVAVGPSATVVFENHDTVLLQIQEMLRTERITREASIRHEIEVYNQLVPGDRELSATLMFEIPDKDEREAFLVRAEHIEKGISIVIGSERFAAQWDESRRMPGRTSAVHYLKFALSDAAIAAIRSGAEIAIEIDHDAYRHRAVLPREVVQSLAEDFA
jgi:hypothetical protein